ncbi:MAG: hypothetical protein C0468_06600, partial [Planctomyces sp.]|nr:hypothetical protein [Planctomyces sp.]
MGGTARSCVAGGAGVRAVRLGVLVACLCAWAPGAAPAWARARGQPVLAPAEPEGNQGVPTAYLDTSPTVDGIFASLDDNLARGHERVAVQLVISVLRDDPERLVASEAEAGLYVPARARAHQALARRPGVLERYRQIVGAEAEAALGRGELERVERSYLLTRAGLESAVRLAEGHIERGRLHAARLVLGQVTGHPDVRGAERDRWGLRAARAAEELARFLSDADVTALRDALLDAVGAEARAVDPFVPGVGSGPAAPPVRTAFETAQVLGLEGLVSKPLWSVSLPRQPFDPAAVAPGGSGVGGVGGGGAEGGGGVGWAGPDPRSDTVALRSIPLLIGDEVAVVRGSSIVLLDRFNGVVRWGYDAERDGPLSERLKRLAEANLGFNGGFRPGSEASVQVEDAWAPASDGRLIVAALGSEWPEVGEGPEALVAIDPAARSVLWTVPVQYLEPQGQPVQVRGPVRVDEGTALVSFRKAQVQRRTVAVFLAGVDLETGRPLWTRVVGSVGSVPGGAPLAATDGAAVDRGVVYRSDRVGVVGAYESRSGRPVWVRVQRTTATRTDPRALQSMGAWQAQVPVIVGGAVHVLERDQETVRVQRLDAQSGSLRGELRLEDGRDFAYLVRAGDHLVAVAPLRLAVMDPGLAWPQGAEVPGPGVLRIDGRLALTESRGRALGADDGTLYVPVRQGVAVVDVGAPEAPARVVGLDHGGNLLAADGSVVVVDDRRAHGYLAWERTEGLLTARLEQDPTEIGAALTLAQAAQRTGRGDRVVWAVGRAVQAMGRAGAPLDRMEPVRAALVVELVGWIDQAQRAPGAAGGAVGVGGAGGAVGLDGPPLAQEHVGALLEHLGALATEPREAVTALVLRGRQEALRGRGVEAAAALHGVLAQPERSRLELVGALSGERADAAAIEGLSVVLSTQGRAALSVQDAEAALEVGALLGGQAAAAPQELEDAALRYPVSVASLDLWLGAAEAWERAGRVRAASRALWRGIAAAERMADTPAGAAGELVGRLVLNLWERGLRPAAASVLARGRARFEGLTLSAGGGALGSELLGEVAAAGRDWRDGPAVGEPTAEGGSVLQGWGLAPSLLPPAVADSPVLAMQNELRRVGLYVSTGESPGPPLEPRWLTPAEPDQVVVVRLEADGALLYRQTAQGKILERVRVIPEPALVWQVGPFEGLFGRGAEPADDAERGLGGVVVASARGVLHSRREVVLAGDASTITMVERTGRGVGIDAQSGRVLWTIEPDAGAAGGVTDTATRGDLTVIASSATGVGLGGG